MVDEKGSVRGTECVWRISSPVRMCHPISGSARGRFDKGPESSDQKRKMKIRSRTDGMRKRNAREPGSVGGITMRNSSVSGFNAGRVSNFEPKRKKQQSL